MEPYAPIGGADPFAASMKLVTALVAELQAPGAAGRTAYGLEQCAAERGGGLQRKMAQYRQARRGVREEETAREQERSWGGTGGIPQTRVKTGNRRMVATLFGRVKL